MESYELLIRTFADCVGQSGQKGTLVQRSSSGFGSTFRLEFEDQRYFIKRLPIAEGDLLEAEADGLRRLAQAGSSSSSDGLRVPRVHGLVELADHRWLVLEWLSLLPLSRSAAGRLGEQLAEHHRRATAARFGLGRDNYIGATPQINTLADDWAEFFFEHRLGALIQRLNASGRAFAFNTIEQLRLRWSARFSEYRPTPSLLHGDLWTGNAGMLSDGTPAVYDPAVHYCDRECDLAMAALFGGFGREFFETYEATWPLETGWELRREFYQLYHVLNHALLFGGGYLSDAERRIEALLKS